MHLGVLDSLRNDLLELVVLLHVFSEAWKAMFAHEPFLCAEMLVRVPFQEPETIAQFVWGVSGFSGPQEPFEVDDQSLVLAVDERYTQFQVGTPQF